LVFSRPNGPALLPEIAAQAFNARRVIGLTIIADFHGAKLRNIPGKVSRFLLGKSQDLPIREMATIR
jgi:hypothetical protein